MKQTKGEKIASYIVIVILFILELVAVYKINEWKLEHIWEIENPTFFQVWDSMGSNRRR